MTWFSRLIGRIPCLRRAVLIQLTDGSAVKGVLYEAVGDWLLVKSPSYLVEHRPPTQMDGDVVIDRARVLFIQVVS